MGCCNNTMLFMFKKRGYLIICLIRVNHQAYSLSLIGRVSMDPSPICKPQIFSCVLCARPKCMSHLPRAINILMQACPHGTFSHI